MSDSPAPTPSPSPPPPPMQYRIRFSDGREFGPAEMETVLTWARDGRVPKSAALVNDADGEAKAVMDDPRIAAILTAPPTQPGQIAATNANGDDSVATIIPYRNPPALVGYYVSIFSLIPVFGLLLGPAAIICGIIGLRKRKAEPQRKGAAHAWIAISIGTLGLLISAACIIAVFMDVF